MKKKFICLLLACSIALFTSTSLAATRVSSEPKGSSYFTGIVTPTGSNTQYDQEYMYRLLDDNRETVFSYVHWTRNATDSIPELEYTFNYNTISDLWIRNGNMSSNSKYYENARIKDIDITIYSLNGTYDYSFLMDDYYDTTTVNDNWYAGYQRLSFPFAISNVYRIELWIKHCYPSTSGDYHLSISDIIFASSSESKPAFTPASAAQGNVNVQLNQRLATRSGPSTKYDELGSYFSAGTKVKAISKAWDSVNEIWWIQVEFTYGGSARRAYTGLKRLNMSADQVPEEYPLSTNANITDDCRVYLGPGTNYTHRNDMITAGTCGTIYTIENGYAQFEYNDGSQYHRVWVPVQYICY